MLAHTGISEDIVRALAHNNNIAESGKVDASAAQKKYVANAAKRMEGLLDRDKVGGWDVWLGRFPRPYPYHWAPPPGSPPPPPPLPPSFPSARAAEAEHPAGGATVPRPEAVTAPQPRAATAAVGAL